MDECEVKLTDGSIVKLRKPNAGVRNKCAQNAFLVSKDDKGVPFGYVNEAKLLGDLLPYCVKEHPWSPSPVRQALDNLSIEDYDKIGKALTDMMIGTDKGDVLGKSVSP